MMESRISRFKSILKIAAIAFLFAAVVISALNYSLLSEKPWDAEIPLSAPKMASLAEDGSLYITDSGMGRILRITPDKGAELYYSGGGSFENAALTAPAHGGGIFVWDAPQDGADAGKTLGRLIKLKDGKFTTIAELDVKSFPRGAGAVAIRPDGAGAELLVVSPAAAELLAVDSAGQKHPGRKWALPRGTYIYAAALSPKKESFAFTTFDGGLYLMEVGSKKPRLLRSGDIDLKKTEKRSAWDLDVAHDGTVVFTDPAQRKVFEISPDGTNERDITPPSKEEFARRQIYKNVSYLGGDFLVTDSGDGVTRFSERGEALAHYNSVRFPLSYLIFRWLVWASAFGAAAGALLLIVLSIKKHGFKKITRNTAILAVASFFSAVILAAVITVVIPTMRSNVTSLTKTDIHHIAFLGAKLLPGDDIKSLTNAGMYRSAAYDRVTSNMAHILELNGSGKDAASVYCVIYVSDGKYLYSLIDSSGAESMLQMYPTYYQTSDTRRNLEEGVQIDYDMVRDENGDWVFSTAPIFDSSGHAVGVLEAGTNARSLVTASNRFVSEFMLLTITLVAIIYMLFCELLAFFAFLRKKACAELAAGDLALNSDARASFLRPLTFLLFFSYSLQSAFVPILAARLCGPVSWLPVDIAAAVPVSASLFACALFGLAAGWFIERIGARATLMLGCAISAAGFALFGTFQTYTMMVAGRFISGIGMGLSCVSVSSLASSAGDENTRASAFTSYNTGMMAGVNIGIVSGSQLVSYIGYSNIYYFAAAVLLLAAASARFYLTGASGGMSAAAGADAGSAPSISAGAFLRSSQVLSFFFCVFIPYTVASYYLYYFFPLFADAKGMSEANIGRFFLLASLIVVNFGPASTKALLDAIGSKWTMLLASAVYALLFAVLAARPTLPLAVLLVVLLSGADGFGFSAQNVYYTSLTPVSLFGNAKAMSIFSLFENIAQTSAPIVFGWAMTFGNAAALLGIGGASVALVPIFLMFSRKRKAERC